ncbi:MAG: heparinase II/III-family protein, partial [Candidatus Eisenbacteria bacterium]|nr:heparinase II/III-family protein [Candidatus Eisenbacteria bacterium]
ARTVILFDTGSPEPVYQPGHAHSEALSFELSRDGRRLFVNSGVSTYEPGPERLRQRGTAAHNTVRIDEEEQTEIWASHRCGRLSDIIHSGRSEGGAFAAHDGYRFLPGRPQHYRKITMTDGSVEIIDKISGEGEHLLEWFFHIHPDATARVRDRIVELSRDRQLVATMNFPFGASAAVADGSWHPGFNTSVHNTLVRVVLRVSLPFEFHTTIDWV